MVFWNCSITLEKLFSSAVIREFFHFVIFGSYEFQEIFCCQQKCTTFNFFFSEHNLAFNIIHICPGYNKLPRHDDDLLASRYNEPHKSKHKSSGDSAFLIINS